MNYSDHSTELQLANEKIQSADNLNNAIKKENERLGKLVIELEEKAEASELQINSISREYRILLEEKEKENKELKKKQHELLEYQAKSALSDQNIPLSHSASTPSLYSSITVELYELFYCSLTYEGHDFYHECFITGLSNYNDDTDIGDTISLQHEVNRLRQQLLQLQSESQHWKSVAGQLVPYCNKSIVFDSRYQFLA
ncbi:hypothetical protein LOTGIDRAFT_159852 [Lottia gigantea]|uniref:Uncharacterized protein n=1 Tax=Lottia gigantea TaxID=225164 RepID=V3ZY44_LOTGI|nr:hypothetical protein LOTGIDRAFT_159852 [Lottia gigantea]ESO96443.1 hypothetical protein LOTGIDRAFT_159852 [Lottia gigantea]